MTVGMKYDVAVVGATGIVGETFLELLIQRGFPVNHLYPLASSRSAGETILFGGKPLLVQNVADFDFSQVQIAFFSAGNDVSGTYAPIAAESGCIVIDNTSRFRYESSIPLVVPEVNPQQLEHYKDRNIIANPNCTTIQIVVALKPIYDAVGITRVNIATYQSVSGAGLAAIEELARETAALLNGQEAEIDTDIFKKQIAFNVLPQIDEYEDNGYTKEEMKMVWELRKILGNDDIQVNPTAVRVPVFYGHSVALHIETQKPIDVEEARELLRQAPGIIVIEGHDYPTAITHAATQDGVFVGRLRKDISHPNGLDMWVVADNVRKGAALNGIQIAELLINQNFYVH